MRIENGSGFVERGGVEWLLGMVKDCVGVTAGGFRDLHWEEEFYGRLWRRVEEEGGNYEVIMMKFI